MVQRHKQMIIIMQNYKIQTKKGEGTYSQVFMATSKLNHQKYALKIMKHRYTNIDKIKKDKQIKALKMLNHPHIIKLMDVLYNHEECKRYVIVIEKMALVFELMDCNLYECYKNKKITFTLDKIRSYCHDMLQAVAYMHQKGVFHRDIKPENILISNDKVVKLADLGSCKSNLISYQFSDIYSSKPFTQYISTRWYRAPQCLLTDGFYSEKMDTWSLGCIMFQLYTHYPLFPGKSQLDQIYTIFNILGTPNQQTLYAFAKQASHLKFDFEQTEGVGLENLIPDAPIEFMDLLKKMLEINPENRIDVKEALEHQFFYSLTELKKYRKVLISKISDSKELILPSLKISKK